MIVDITAEDIQGAREQKVFPQTLAFQRLFPDEDIRANPVCVILKKQWLKIRLPFFMWDWSMGFVQGEDTQPVTLEFDLVKVLGEDTIIANLDSKDFRDSEWKPIPVVEAR